MLKQELYGSPRKLQTKARYKKELAYAMGYSLRTFQRRLKEANINTPRGLICPEKQQEIFEKLGWHQVA
ncbi:MAG: hypothetical protein KDC61_20190 [Saprospiraceae bacterium]|nr:hypothetical protein [Saprospiraceae bacterium]MCB0543796.1 hypothetical protein [Saprospiraceae bacterium]MCB0576890.1 hypothetical protein [Saprospiraceae bacterium]MCB9307383.1 hypothetical protein [Lewinellaceae bacterium]MCB9355831.1 hypothetical protein [Lewinellaceae bacterium]